MSDPRITPDPAVATRSDPAQISVSVADLCRSPDGLRDRQLIFGDHVEILGNVGNWRYVRAAKDGYCGYVQRVALGTATEATHIVTAPATHAYARADMKSPDQISLSFGSRVTAHASQGSFIETAVGFVPHQHLAEASHNADDPSAVATLFLGTPYLWGGNSRWGIDCSGLVQAALSATGIPCPGDSDMQQTLGTSATGPFKRNDLLFWKGHVALVTDPETLIHANAAAMATVYEPINIAIERIEAQGDGPVTAHRRL